MKTRYILSLVLAALVVAPTFGQEPESRASRKDTSKQEIQELRQALEELRKQEQVLRLKIEELTRSLEGKEPGEHRRLRRLPERERRAEGERFDPRRPRFEEHMRGLEEHLEELRRAWPRMRRFAPGAGRGYAMSLKHGHDGVRVEIRKRGEDGKEKVEVYEADSPEAFKKKHPELAEKYNLRMGEGGSFDLEFGPRRRRGRDLTAPRPPRDVPFGRLNRPDRPARLGVMVEEADGGLRIVRVEEGSLARELGVQEKDVLVAVNGHAIKGIGSVREGLQKTGKDGKVTVEVQRDDEKIKLEGKRDAPRRLR